jgi:hypothetical protein
VFVPASVTLDPQKAVLQQAALEILIELLTDELRQVPARGFDFPQEAGVVLGNDRIQSGPFRAVSPVSGWRGKPGC